MSNLARFYIVGGSGAIAYALLAAFLVGGLQWPVAVGSVVAYSIVLPPFYLLQRQFAFRSSARHRAAFRRYAAVQIVSLAIGTIVADLLVIVRVPTQVAFLVAAGAIGLCSFLVHDRWTFAA